MQRPDHILVVYAGAESEALVRDFSFTGQQLTFAPTIGQAFNQLEISRPSIVIVDLTSEVKDTIDFCRVFKNLPGLDLVPLVLLAGKDQNQTLISGFKAGADDCLQTPFSKKQFRLVIKKNLNKNRRRFEFGQLSNSFHILEKVPFGLVIGSKQGQLIFSNAVFHRFFTHEKVAQVRNLFDLCEFLFQPGTNTRLPLSQFPPVRVLGGKEGGVIEADLKIADKKIPLEIWAEPIRTEVDETKWVFGGFRDISKLAIETQQNRANQLRYQMLFETMAEGAIILSDKLVIEASNSNAERILGLSRSEMNGQTLQALWKMMSSSDTLPSQLSHVERGELISDEHVMLSMPGKELHVAFSSRPSFDDNTGELLKTMITFSDISSNIKDREAKKRLHQAISQLSECIIMTDVNGIITFANQAAVHVTGYLPAELIGQSTTIWKSGKQSKETYRNLWKTILSGKEWSGTLLNKKKDGSLYYEDQTITPFFDGDGKITGFISVKKDVNEETKLRQKITEVQKLESIGTLAAGIAHDFNNILAMVLTEAEFIELNARKKQASVAVSNIYDAIERGKDMIDQILSFSKPVKEDLVHVDCKSEIKKALRFIENTISSTIELNINICDEDVFIMGNSTKLRQVVINICTNAIRAMNFMHGELKVTVEKQKLDILESSLLELTPGTYVKLTFSDTGAGIPEEIQHRIFEPFFSTKSKDEASGLGLSVTYGIVRDFSGKIKLQSTLNVGTTFEVYLPAVTKAMAKKNARPVYKRKHRKSKGHLLFVEDENSLRKSGKLMLETIGYQVSTAVDGLDALNTITGKGDFDLVLTDRNMPNLTGVELARQLNSFSDIPVLLITGLVDDDDHTDLKNIKGTLRKPVSWADISKKIDTIIG